MMKVYIDTLSQEIASLHEGLAAEGVTFDDKGVPVDA